MRLLVVTLATIENEVEECLAAIGRHTHTDYEHLVLRNLPNRESRRATWGILPSRLRMEALRGGWLSLPLRWAVPLAWRDRIPAMARRMGRRWRP